MIVSSSQWQTGCTLKVKWCFFSSFFRVFLFFKTWTLSPSSCSCMLRCLTVISRSDASWLSGCDSICRCCYDFPSLVWFSLTPIDLLLDDCCGCHSRQFLACVSSMTEDVLTSFRKFLLRSRFVRWENRQSLSLFPVSSFFSLPRDFIWIALILFDFFASSSSLLFSTSYVGIFLPWSPILSSCEKKTKEEFVIPFFRTWVIFSSHSSLLVLFSLHEREASLVSKVSFSWYDMQLLLRFIEISFSWEEKSLLFFFVDDSLFIFFIIDSQSDARWSNSFSHSSFDSRIRIYAESIKGLTKTIWEGKSVREKEYKECRFSSQFCVCVSQIDL